ncbi:MAG: cytochrome c oxidase subunit II [Gammaproteobacteria bacterium]|nr:cytochrome c oxidase subunit II [Gammaproteobacteria bacterium]TVQ45937.1 MAG: cytochrome c oxidase subunit II [Gammaproteobacteria bacterium]
MLTATFRRGLAAAMTALAATLAPAATLANDWQLNMPIGVTDISADVYRLHMTILWICIVIGVIVFSAMIYSIFRHRKSLGVEPAKFSHSTKVEVVWTIVPVFILIGMAIPATETLVRMEDTSGSDLTIKVTGYQWLWEYEYLDEDVRFFSRLHRDSDRARQLGSGIDPFSVENYLLEVDNRMVVPVDAKVRLLLTAGDVIHAWWVPDFAVKKDAIPGFINEVWFQANETGVFRGQCAELCGRDHGFMPIVVEVKSQEDYQAWLAAQRGELGDRPVASTNR